MLTGNCRRKERPRLEKVVPEDREDGDRVAAGVDRVEVAVVVDERVLGGEAVHDRARLGTAVTSCGVRAGG